MIDDVFIYGIYVWDQNNLNSWQWAFVQWKQGKPTVPAASAISLDFVCMHFDVKKYDWNQSWFQYYVVLYIYIYIYIYI